MDMQLRMPGKHAGLSLIEILVVIAILGILLGIMLPVFGSARASADRALCANNQRQIAMVARAYAADYRDYMGQASALDYRDGATVNNGLNLPAAFTKAGMHNTATRHPDHYAVLGYLPADASNDGRSIFQCRAAARYFDDIASTYWQNKGNVESHYFFTTLLNPPTVITSARKKKNNAWGPYKSNQIQRPDGVFLLGDAVGLTDPTDSTAPAAMMDTYTWDQVGELSTVFGVATTPAGVWLESPPSYHRGGPNGTFFDGHVETIDPPATTERYRLRQAMTANYSGKLSY